MRLFKIILPLGGLYLFCWFILAGIGLSNDRSDGLLAAGQAVMFFVKYILGFPLNIVSLDYPFLMDSTGNMIESDVHPLVLIALNFSIQVALINLIAALFKRRQSRN